MSVEAYERCERELTRRERSAIRKLVLEQCANYDSSGKACLPLDCPCYMLDKWWTGAFCRYFADAILSAEPTLKAMLIDNQIPSQYKKCPVCGKAFLPVTRQQYCSDSCRATARRKSERARKRRARQNKR